MSDLVAQFKKAVEEFDRRVEQIRDDQWELPTPCSEWNVRDLVGHLVYEDKWAAPLLEGQTIEQVGDRFEGDLLGDDPLVAWRGAAGEAVEAIEQEGALRRTVHLSYGDRPADEYLLELLNDHVIHAWDLARGIYADEKLDPELVEMLYERARPLEEALKATGSFGEKVEVPDDSDTQTKLLAIMGREL